MQDEMLVNHEWHESSRMNSGERNGAVTDRRPGLSTDRNDADKSRTVESDRIAIDLRNPESRTGRGRRCLSAGRHLGRVRRRREAPRVAEEQRRGSRCPEWVAGWVLEGLRAGARGGMMTLGLRYLAAGARFLRKARTPGFGRSFRMISRFLTRWRGSLRRLASNGAGWLKRMRRVCRRGSILGSFARK